MRLLTRSRLVALVVSAVILGGFGLALVRGDNVSVRIPDKDEWMLNIAGEWPDPPASPAEFVALGSHLPVPRTVAIATIGARLRENPEVYAPRGILTPSGIEPPPMLVDAASTDYALRLDEVLSESALAAGLTVTLRLGGAPSPPGRSGEYFNPAPHPREGRRLLMVLVPDPRVPSSGTYACYVYGTVDVSGATAHFNDAWRTSVKEMGAPESTPAFIEAVRAALAAP